MSRQSKQKEKILWLLKFFYEHSDDENGVTIQDMIDYLSMNGIDAERKSLYSDLEVLKDFGYDIVSGRGRYTQYYFNSHKFELAELKVLVDSVQSSKFITQKKSNELIKKLESLTSEKRAKELHRQVTVINRNKVNNEKIYYNVDRINQAITSKVQISFFYYEWVVVNDGVTRAVKKKKRDGYRYIVSPKTLMWDDENYYLVAYDNNTDTLKHFRVDKMENVEFEDKKIISTKGLEKFDPGVYSKQIFGMYGGDLVNISLVCDNSIVGVMADRFGEKVYIKSNDNETFKLETKVMLSPQFYGWLFSLGERVKLTAPLKAIKEYKAYIKKIGSMYEK